MNDRCVHCGDRLAISSGPKVGRPQKYCSTACRQAAFRCRKNGADETSKPPTRPAAQPSTPEDARASAREEPVIEILKDLVAGARDLQRALADPGTNAEEPLKLLTHLQAQLEGITAGAVGRARGRGLTWSRISKTLGISEDTARHRYTDQHIARRLSRFTRVPSPAPNPQDSPPRRDSDSPPTVPCEPPGPSSPAFNRLAPVLSMLARTTQMPMKDISSRIGCSASYLSRIMSGERTPTWTLTEKFARACGADPSVLHTVWESEHLREKSPLPEPLSDKPLPASAALLAEIQSLHARAGTPTPHDVTVAAHGAFRVEQIAPILEGTAFPSRHIFIPLVQILGGDITYFGHLWTKALNEQKNIALRGPLSAEAFG